MKARGSRQIFPVTPSPTNAFALQPVAQEYMAAARAVATSVAYRYTGINLGYGYTRGRVAVLDDVLTAHPTPMHYAQVVLAEWLLVFAALFTSHPDCGCMTSLNPGSAAFTAPDRRSTVVNSPAEVLTRPEDVGAGTHFPSLSAVLVYIADWLGAVIPAYQSLSHGDVKGTVKPLLHRIQPLFVSTAPPSCAARTWLKQGKALSDDAFVVAVAEFMRVGGETVQHACRLVTADADDEAEWVQQFVSTSTAGCSGVAVAIDAATSYRASQVVYVPQSVFLAERDIDTALDSRTAVVARGAGKWFPLLPFELGDAALEYVVIDAATATLVNALPKTASARDFQEVRSRACTLFYTGNQRAVTAAARSAFETRFPDVALALKTVRAVPDKSSTDDVTVHPGRHAHPGGTMLGVYYTPEAWQALQPQLSEVVSFFRRTEVLRTADGHTYFATIAHQPDGIPLHTATHELTRNGRSYNARQLSRPVAMLASAVGTSQLVQAPFWSVVLMREDLLAIAVSDRASYARRALVDLWARHVPGLAGRRFQDEIAVGIITATVNAKKRRVSGAAKWAAGAMVELVFGFWDVSSTLDLLDDLDTFLTKARVVQHTARGSTVHDELSVGVETECGATMSTRFLMDGDDLVAVSIPPHECPTVPFDAIAAWTEPLLRGFCITTTQAAVISALGTPTEQAALQYVAHACEPEQINTTTLYTVTAHDKAELLWHAGTPASRRLNQFPDTASDVTLNVHA